MSLNHLDEFEYKAVAKAAYRAMLATISINPEVKEFYINNTKQVMMKYKLKIAQCEIRFREAIDDYIQHLAEQELAALAIRVRSEEHKNTW